MIINNNKCLQQLFQNGNNNYLQTVNYILLGAMIQVFPSNPQWNHVLFKVQLILADPSIELTRVTKFASEFQPKYMTHMKIDCAINATNLSQQDIETLKYGNPSKYVFEAGHIKLSSQVGSPIRSQSQVSIGSTGSGKVKKLLLYKIAMDQCMPIHKSGAQQLITITQFPANIDTIYVSDSKQQLNIYPHKYRVKDKSQCLLEYQVDFVVKGLANTQKWDPQSIICEYCECVNAIYYCPQQKQLFCAKCFQQLHRTAKKKNHEQHPVSAFNSAPYCSFHPKQRLTYYCLDCMDLRCDSCIKNQVHKGDKKHTQIMLLPDLQKTLKDKQKSFIKQAKDRTKSLISKAQTVIGKLNRNYQNQKTDLQQKFSAKLTVIREQSNKKMMTAVCLHSELKRKYDELLWVQNFVHYCQEFMLAQDSIQMKDSFFVYLDSITGKQYYSQADRKMEQLQR